MGLADNNEKMWPASNMLPNTLNNADGHIRFIIY